MRTGDKEFDDGLSSHPNEGTMIEYYEGLLGEVEHENVQYHLVHCDDCLALFRDVKTFFEPAVAGASTVAQDEIGREIERIWTRIESEKPSSKLPNRVARWTQPWAQLAVAATLLILFMLAGIWLIKARRENQLLAERAESLHRQLEEEQQRWQSRVEQLQEENLALQDRARSTEPDTGAQPQPRSESPELNVPIYDLYSRGTIRRSGEASDINQIKVPPGAKSLLLILNAEGKPAYQEYSLEILDRRGQSAWRGRGLRRDGFGNFVLRIDKKFLARGTYHLNLHGKRAGIAEPVAEYLLRID